MSETIDTAASPTVRKDRTHWLYIAVVVAVVLGVLVGLAGPRRRQAAEAPRHQLRQPHQDDDLPGHLLHDRPGHRVGAQGHQVGRVGGLALGYFVVMSTVALAIGLVVGNVIHPGPGLDIHTTYKAAGGGGRRVA